MACDGTLLSAYLDDELTDTERGRVEAHLKACAACAAELESLEKTRTMLTAYAIPTGLHERFLTQFAREARRREARRGRWMAGLAAAAVVAVAAAAYLFFNQAPSGGPDAPAVAPVAVQQQERPAAPEPAEPAQAPAPAPEEPALAQIELPFELRGTVEGAVPQAVIADTSTGRSATYGIEDEIRPGVRLQEVRSDAVVLSLENGESRVLALGSAAATTLSPAGDWVLTVIANGQDQDKAGAKIKEYSGKIEIRLGSLDARAGAAGPVLLGTRTGRQFVVAGTHEGVRLDMVGMFDDSMAHAGGSVARTATDGRVEHANFEMVRVTDEAVLEQQREAEAEAERREELEALYEPLKRYANAKDGRFPAALRDLVPDTLPDLELYANTDGRTVQYVPGGYLPGQNLPSLSSYEGGSMRDALLALERDLQQAWGSTLPFRAVLWVDYTDPVQRFAVANSGTVLKISKAEPAQSEPEAARDRAQSQNNLKQLAVIFKMFAAEHDGYLPGGWLTAYPEYLTDLMVLTAPWDEPLTDSYDFLFPGMSEAELVQMAEQMGLEPDMNRGTEVPGTTQREAALQALIPTVVEKLGEPFANKCRNVVFLDGHVECVSPSGWAERVAPFAAIAGR